MGFNTNLLYFIGDAFRSIRENLATAVFTSIVLGFSLAIFALFIFIFVNLNIAVNSLGNRVHILVYIKDSGLSLGPERLKKEVSSIPGVKDVEYVSKEKALRDLREGLKGHEGILEGIDVNPLPASLEIRVTESSREPAKFSSIVEAIRRLPWTDDVQYSREWLKRLSGFLKFIEAGALIIGVFLAAATFFIITNTIRLTVYARKEDIEVIRLVGATDAFITAPFLIEGLIEGFAGGLLAMGVLALGRYMLAANVPAYLDFVIAAPLPLGAMAGILLAAGVLMGGFASLLSTGRFLRT